MEVVENLEQWQETFAQNWLAHFKATGDCDWDRYNRPHNRSAPPGPGIDLSRSRLALITTAGGYLPASQRRFDAENDLGDYTVRCFSVDTPYGEIAYAHTHYDHTAVNKDPQVLLPLGHLADLVDEGVIGELAPSVISFMGYQPDVARIVYEMIPAIVAAAQAEAVDAALLVPS